MTRLVAFVALALLSTACRSTTALLGVDSFFRPEAVTFACYDEATQRVVELARCEAEVDPEDIDDRDELRLLVLVTQWARGQVAAVDVALGEAVDASELIPGFTYVNVGVSPTGIVHVDPSDAGPAVTVVSSYGARRIETVETGVFHPDIPAESGDGRFLRSALTLPDSPTDVAFVPTGDDLPGSRGIVVVALPGVGSIGTVELLDDGTLDESSLQILPVSDAPASPLGGGLVDEADPWQRICPADRALPLATAALAVPAAPGLPAPHRVRIDEEGDVPILLVADEGVPYIHRFEIVGGALTELDPIASPAPLLDLTFTPRLGRSLVDAPDMPTSERVLYAIDATDRSVVAIDYDETSPNFGDTLAVQRGEGRSDRIFFRSGARRIEVFTPGMLAATDPDDDEFGLCDPSDVSRAELARPDRLRGVFLAAALADGRMQFADVWDFDAPCRGGDAACQNPRFAEDVYVSIRRNRPRLASFVSARPRITGTPTLRFGSSPGRIGPSGRPATGDGPGLEPFASCPAGEHYLQGYPDAELHPNEGPLVCLGRDPWSGAIQRFTAVFEGEIAGSEFDGARLVDGPNARPSLVLDGFDFCAVGSLGLDNVEASGLGPDDPELGYGGDFVEITTDLPFSRRDDPACGRFIIPENGERDPIVLRVLESARGRLDLGDGPETTVAEVRACFTRPFGGELRVRDAFAVRSTVSRLRHRVVGDAEERCIVDVAGAPFDPEDPSTAANFRALEGRPFIHPVVAFTIGDPGSGGLTPGASTEAVLTLDVGRVPAPLTLPGEGHVRDLAWSPIDQRLYAVDTSNNSLLRIRADRLAVTERLN